MIAAAERMKITELIGAEVVSPIAVPATWVCSVLLTVMNRITSANEKPWGVNNDLIGGNGTE